MFILHALLFCLFLFLLVSGSAADCDCGIPWTFHLICFVLKYMYLEVEKKPRQIWVLYLMNFCHRKACKCKNTKKSYILILDIYLQHLGGNLVSRFLNSGPMSMIFQVINYQTCMSVITVTTNWFPHRSWENRMQFRFIQLRPSSW